MNCTIYRFYSVVLSAFGQIQGAQPTFLDTGVFLCQSCTITVYVQYPRDKIVYLQIHNVCYTYVEYHSMSPILLKEIPTNCIIVPTWAWLPGPGVFAYDTLNNKCGQRSSLARDSIEPEVRQQRQFRSNLITAELRSSNDCLKSLL